MSIYFSGEPQRSTPAPSAHIHRRALILLLCALLGIAGAITYTANTSGTSSLSPTQSGGLTSHFTPLKHTTGSTKHAKATATLKSIPRPGATTVKTTTTQAPVSPVSPAQPPLPPVTSALFSGNTSLPEVALTFDDGPNPYYTQQVLAILQQYGVNATFFDVGYLVKDYPSVVKQEYDQGNVVGDHSWGHPDLTQLSAANSYSQIATAADAIQSAIGVRPTFFRPPYGAVNATIMRQAFSLNLSTVMWDNSASDWSLPGVGVIIQRTLNMVHNGSIVLMHDGGGNRSQTVAALPTIITSLRARGYRLVTMEQLLRDLHGTASASFAMQQPGTIEQTSGGAFETHSSAAWKRETPW